MSRYNGFFTVMGVLILVAALVFLALTYVARYPGYVSLGVLAAAFFIRWARKKLKEPEPQKKVLSEREQRTDRDFDAWMSLGDK